jgi:hypothetical protein
MSDSKLRIRFGDYRFEIEGPADHVERQFDAFRRMLAPEPEPAPFVEAVSPASAQEKPKTAGEQKPPLALEKILRMKANVISLGVRAKVEDAILVILLGQRNVRQNNSVSGMEIMRGLRQSGIEVPRADMILKKYAQAGLVVASGRRKLRRYRLSTDGGARAEQIALRLISQVPTVKAAEANAGGGSTAAAATGEPPTADPGSPIP